MGWETLEDVPGVGNRHRGALYVVRGDLRRIQADAYLLPTDSFGTVTGTWAWLIGRDGRRCRQLHPQAEVLSARSGVWLDGAMGGRTALAADVGGYEFENSVEGLTHRLRSALMALDTPPAHAGPGNASGRRRASPGQPATSTVVRP